MSKGPWKKKQITATNGTAVLEKPSLGLPDPQEALAETARLAQEGNRKLSLSVDAMREALELIVTAEVDRETGMPVTAQILRSFAVAGLDAYSTICGQNWRRAKLTGPSRAGDRSMNFGDGGG